MPKVGEELATGFEIAERQIIVDGKPRFVLSDYALPVVSDATDDELAYYLDKRISQGFSAIQISTLPVPHDRVHRKVPLAFDEELLLDQGRWVFNEQYFMRFSHFLDEIASRGLLLLLGFYCNVHADTRFARSDGSRYVMPPEVKREYLGLLSEALSPVRKSIIFMIDIDGTFHSEVEIDECVMVCETLRELLPGVRLSYYPAPSAYVPDELIEKTNPDLYINQVGHGVNSRGLPVELAVHYSSLGDRRPVIGIEAGYEQHRVVGGTGRFGRREVRRSMWNAVLAGGSSGAGYAAHGVWGWNRNGESATCDDRLGRMPDWRDGLHLPGAEDVGFVRRVVEGVGCVGLPFTSVRSAAPSTSGWDTGICSESADGALAAFYLPYGGPVDLGRCGLGDRSPIAVEAFDLETRLPLSGDVSGSAGANLLLDLPGSNSDVVAFLRY